METEPLWNVWAEGYAATGERGTATFVGSVRAATFVDACRILHNDGWGQFSLTPDGQPMYWGCRLFDNEADARKTYG